MKLSNLTAKLTSIPKLTSIKSNAVRVLAVGALAGAALTAASPAAHAQRFYVGVRGPAPVFVGPRFVAPVPPVAVYPGPAFGYGYAHPRFQPGFAPRFEPRFDPYFHHEPYRGGWRR